MNLYGVSSIRLDKIRGKEMKSILNKGLILYSFILVISFMLPERVVRLNLGNAHLTGEDSDLLWQFNSTINLNGLK